MSLETKVLDIIDGKKKAPLLFPLLRACSFAYGSGVALRHLAYRLGVCKSHQVASFVVSVGNIACGGTGKTPFVRFLAKALRDSNKVAILSRGYRSPSEHARHPLLISGGDGPLLSAEVCGDEPFLLASSLSGVSIWVGKHRHEAARRASEQGADIVILDDGMQYRKLSRDVEIAIVDGQDLLAGGRLLPAGRLRDFPGRLKSADLIVVNHAEKETPLSVYEETLRAFTQAPLITVRSRPVAKPSESIAGRRVGVFCALGRPDRFFDAIREVVSDVVGAMAAPDHMSISEEDLGNFAAHCRKKGAEALVCSAKDAVKMPQAMNLDLPFIVVDAEIELLQGHDAWHALLERIQEKRKSQ